MNLKLEAIDALRIAIGTAIVQSGYVDQDPNIGEIELLQWHPCPECIGNRCACSGVPYLSDEIWNKINIFGGLEAFFSHMYERNRTTMEYTNET